MINCSEISLNMSWFEKKGLFEHKWTLDFIFITSINAKWLNLSRLMFRLIKNVGSKFRKFFVTKTWIWPTLDTVLSHSWPKSFARREYCCQLIRYQLVYRIRTNNMGALLTFSHTRTSCFPKHSYKIWWFLQVCSTE